MLVVGHQAIEPAVWAEIESRLDKCEYEHDVRIIYAIESGSRAWGFPSPDSDYDVRFIYIRPREWYLSFDVERQRDVIEYPIVDEIDINGWDLRKALYLFNRTNGALLEWLGSPIIYREMGKTAKQLRALSASHFNSLALCYHYSHLARGQAPQLLKAEKVKLKRYFYTLRPLLAIRWILAEKGIPPVLFEELLMSEAPQDLIHDVQDLLELKRKTPELGEGAVRPLINDFIEKELCSHEIEFIGQGRPTFDNSEYRDALNRIFRSALPEAEKNN